MRSGMARLSIVFLGPLVAVSAFGEEPAIPNSRMGLPTAPLLLLSRQDVRADLGLTPEQSEAASRQMAVLHARAAELKGKSTAEVLTARRAIDDAQQRFLSETLSSDQRDRLSQIELQWEGPAAIVRRRAIADELSLTDEQRKALAEAVSHRDAERARGKTSPADEIPLAERTLAILSADQRELWLKMLGRHCAFQHQVAQAASAPKR